MVLKGVLSVSLYVSAMLLANHAAVLPSGIDATVGLVASGGTAEVKIGAAPCSPLTITLEIGTHTQTLTLDRVPGSVEFDIPSGTIGRLYTITIVCATDRTIRQGIVA